jgi:hypothetical protein
MIDYQRVAEYLETQAAFCKERAWAEHESADVAMSMELRYDIYAVLAQAIRAGLGESPTWPPQESPR